jgi:hypothetical protein
MMLVVSCRCALLTRCGSPRQPSIRRENAGATPVRLCTPLRADGFAVFTPGEPGKHAAQQARRMQAL